ncbi:pyridoxamine 5'-phosphate oxidase family protein [Piscinibacter defluvii]|uniref:pyridoxamine 5'-phosphate oxidase family protein n=1 Tax=Piscinibacter defluvii TaxID=1796922 RepID=UPI00197BF3EF|nr:pyridoxamine 5'-phosphate oxidase family protein [Piscinibacter defluvii]
MSEALTLDLIRPCLEGAIPGVMATCSDDGVPNVAYLSQVEYVDERHLALSFQFFNKTRRNVLANPQVELLVVDPRDGTLWRLRARYLRTETEGPLFERMKAKLAGIASHTGMAGVFRLLGSDVYELTGLHAVSTPALPPPPPPRHHLVRLRRSVERLAACTDLAGLVEATLDTLAQEHGVTHAMLLMFDAAGQRLYTVGSRGYGSSGVGSEIPLDAGVIGVAARLRCAIRINHLTLDYAYTRGIRERLTAQGGAGALESEIPWPGLAEPHSQLALPLVCADSLQGVLFVESSQDMRFGWDDEDALAAFAAQLAALVRGFQLVAEAGDEGLPAAAAPAAPRPAGAPLRVRHFEADGSLFLDDDYLIKGVAGRILWHLLGEHARQGRSEFSNRELRLAPQIGLPELGDNLEARLLLLTRRLAERRADLRLEKTGRGRFRLVVGRMVQLLSVPR